MQEDDQVDPQDPRLNSSPKSAREEAEQAEAMGLAARECYWNDKKYSDGATVCDSGQRYKCWSGRWVDIGNC
jgi:hypothetical protein